MLKAFVNMLSLQCVMGLDTESDQRADGEPESDSEKNVTNAGHGGGSGLPAVARVGLAISVNGCDALNERERVGAVLADDVFIVFVFPTLYEGVGAVLVIGKSPVFQGLNRLRVIRHGEPLKRV